MQSDTTTSSLSVSRNGVLVVDGYGIRITVNRGHLVVHDGIGRARREARFARATSGLRRIVLLGRTGFVSLEALAWLSDTSAAFLQLHPDGRVLVASAGYGVDDPRLRRAQAAAFGTETGMAIARDLIARKLAGQLRVADQLGAEDAITEIARACDALAAARTPAELMVPEAAGAAAYWAAWAPIELRWARADDHRIPDHSRSFGSRASPLTGTSRTAATPAGALLNLGYALLEAEARFACLSTGLDPGLGVLHSDLRARDSLALDVMEAVRPDVDAFVLKLLRERTFRAADFHEDRRGAIRVLAPLTHELAGTIPLLRARLAPVVESVARAIAAGPDSRVTRLPTLLTGGNRSAGRNRVRVHSRPNRDPQSRLASVCRTCGGPVPSAGRDFCNRCLPERVEEQRSEYTRAGHVAVARLRAQGLDPGHGGNAAASRGRKVSESRRAARDWDLTNEPRPDSEVFRRDVLARLKGWSAVELARRTGLSRPYCNAILRGERVPHQRWWVALRDLSPAPPV